MNLKKVFAIQKVLRERIAYNNADRFEKLILALKVEIGECANELPEIFKFWSQKDNNFENALVEYVDGLHLVLECGLEIEFDHDAWQISSQEYHTVTEQFLALYECVTILYKRPTESNFVELIETFLGLGKMLGFTQTQIEEAYLAKNAVNHQRQEDGY
ncbi:dUTP diphosphatase [Bacillus mesophilum]|uniref:dUTPase n=1 Tax=Bacillus mesophilum TaxID=1071718 RepID=A0A7V7RP88_9BACI|nr:dUTP diphosphatase [Bacillus mesophilum]KAB2335060.1 dUTPase [Bacillus mesophilum]